MLNSKRARLKAVPFRSPKFINAVPVDIGFRVPSKVAICVRRKTRKEVIFAKGKGGKGTRRPKRNKWCDVHC